MSHRPTPRSDRGEVTSQTVILIPVLVLLALMTVQLAVYFHAANVATAAANGGAAAGAPKGKGTGAASAAASSIAGENGATLAGVSVSGGDLVTVSVTVRVQRIVPFFPATVTRRAIEPKERFVEEGDR